MPETIGSYIEFSFEVGDKEYWIEARILIIDPETLKRKAEIDFVGYLNEANEYVPCGTDFFTIVSLKQLEERALREWKKQPGLQE